MAGRRNIYGGENTSDSLFLSRPSPSFLGSRSMVSFEDADGSKRTGKPFFGSFNDDNNVDEECDEFSHQPEKKRRLAIDQVQFLEKSFEVENKLEPERKMKLAKDLGLQPRQVAIWFQNRRARWKSKQLEKDYDVLQCSFNSLKADYEGLIKEKEKLNAEVLHLNGKLRLQQNEKTNSDQSGTEKPPKSPSQEPINQSLCEGEDTGNPVVSCKQEDISSAKSDVLDSESSRYTDEEDNLSKSMVAPSLNVFPKIEDDDTYSGYYGFPVEDQALEFWPY